MKKIAIILIFVFLLFSNVASAGDAIIGFLSEELYNDCQGKDIYFPEGLLTITGEDGVPQPFEKLVWPYTIGDIQRIITVIVKNDPYGLKVGYDREDFMELLRCGDDVLRVNFDAYYWKGEKVDPFYYNLQQIFQYAENITTEKFLQLAQIGEDNIMAIDNSSVTKVTDNGSITNTESNWFSKNNITIGSIGFTIAISASVVVALEGIKIQRKRKSKSRRKKKPVKIKFFKLPIPKEPLDMREKAYNSYKSMPQNNRDTYWLWRGQKFPKFLWEKWKDELKNQYKVSYRDFLKILGEKKEELRKWARMKITWEEYITEIIDLIEKSH